MFSLNFCRIADGLIRKNWVMTDILDVYRQLDVDIRARMSEFNKALVQGSIPFSMGNL